MDKMADAALVPVTESAPAPVPDNRLRVPSGRPRRAFAWGIDYLVVTLPGLALVGVVVTSMVQSLPAFLGAVAAEAGWSRVVHLFTSNGALGLSDAAAREWLVFALPLIVALLAVPLFQFLYHAILLGWRGRTIGMMVADVRIEATATRDQIRFGRAVARAAVTTVMETGLVGVALVSMLFGLLRIGVLVWGAAVILFWLNILAALGPRRRTLVDRLVGTVMVRTSVYATVAQGIATVGRHGAALVATATRAATEATTAAGRAISDAAAITGDLARQGAQALARSPAVRPALDSDAAAQARAIAAAGAERARQLGGEAVEQVRDLSGRAAERVQTFGRNTRRLWRDRQANP